MSSLRSKIKANARIILSGNWMKAIVIFLIIFFLSIALSSLETAYSKAFNFPTIEQFENAKVSISRFARTTMLLSVLFSLVTFVLTTPLKLGQTEWYWNLADRKARGIEGVFAWFGSFRLFLKSLWLKINIGLRLLPWFILTIGIPYAMIFVSMIFMDSTNPVVLMLSFVFASLGFLLLVCGAFAFLYITTKYFLAQYLLVEDNTRKVNGCVRDSIKYTRSQRRDLFVFYLSFIGWFALCIFVFPLLWVLPYYNASSAIYSKFIIYSERLRGKNEGAPVPESGEKQD